MMASMDRKLFMDVNEGSELKRKLGKLIEDMPNSSAVRIKIPALADLKNANSAKNLVIGSNM